MGLIGDSDAKTAVNLSLPQRVVERLHYEAKHHKQKRAFMSGDVPVAPSVQYEGEELTADEVDLVEQFIGWKMYDSVPRKYFD
ncbi:hypothetical protein LPA44_09015 [Halobacterium sp. KA-4]|uniref:hypothetical protein n=1 Tax=Halobacterium sp. KA-4 TaxID=2896367 RepID=UPI001E5F2190|nr:hypothetical protein [Halobacterium sp. KA-4]MCD2200036.1 hypothetical protein [Halobacterium sp. KA-4]